MKCMFECVRGCVTWGWMFLTLTLTPNYCYSPQRCLQPHGLINLFTHHTQLRESQTGVIIRSMCVLHVYFVHFCVYLGLSWRLCDVVVVCVCVKAEWHWLSLSHLVYPLNEVNWHREPTQMKRPSFLMAEHSQLRVCVTVCVYLCRSRNTVDETLSFWNNCHNSHLNQHPCQFKMAAMLYYLKNTGKWGADQWECGFSKTKQRFTKSDLPRASFGNGIVQPIIKIKYTNSGIIYWTSLLFLIFIKTDY